MVSMMTTLTLKAAVLNIYLAIIVLGKFNY